MKNLISFIAISLIPGLAWGQNGCYPISVKDNQLELMSTMDGVEIPTILTFGTLSAVIPKHLAEQLNKDIKIDRLTEVANVIGGEPSHRKYIEDLDVKFLGIDTKFDEVTVVERESKETNFVVSLLLFRDMILQLDFPGGKLCLSDRAGSNLNKVANVEMHNEGGWGIPAIEARLNGTEDSWLIMAPEIPSGLILDSDFANKLGFSPPPELEDGAVTYQETVESLQLGPYTLGNIPVDIPVPDQEHLLETEGNRSIDLARGRTVSSNGRIGMDVLKHFVLTIDLVNTRMHIYAP